MPDAHELVVALLLLGGERREELGPLGSRHGRGVRRGAETDGLVDDELGAAAHLLVDAADVFAEDADADQLDAAEEGDEDDEGRVAPEDGPAHELVEEVDRGEQEGESGDDEAQHGAQLQRVGGEAEDAVEADAQGAEEAVVVGLARRAGAGGRRG
jgi:hypothetical protein